MFKKITPIAALLLLLLFISCDSNDTRIVLKPGHYDAEIFMQDKSLPFGFDVYKDSVDYRIDLINGKEIIALDEITVTTDSLFITLHIFDIEIHAKINENSLEGVYIKNYIDDYQLPFKAVLRPYKTINKPKASASFDGKWDMTFTGEDGSISKGVGIFKTANSDFKGTILTPVGDYRYLTGNSTDNNFTLRTFDGNHAFIFQAQKINDTIIEGDFWSGKSFHESFRAVKNEKAALTDANELTFLNDGYDRLEFSFPDLNGKYVSLDDEKYKDKVVLVQIFGTWCPNCMDETIFYADWYEKNKHRDVEIIGLAYEAKPDFNYAKSRVEKMIEKLNVNYDFLIAGTLDKKEAAKTLPMLNHVLSFPTTVFINKKGKVSKIHTGFSGPATGEYYTAFKKEFNTYMDFLLDDVTIE